MTRHFWRAILNGRTSLNGALYSVRFHGDLAASGEARHYDMIAAIAAEIAPLNAEMEIVEQMQITVGLPDSAVHGG